MLSSVVDPGGAVFCIVFILLAAGFGVLGIFVVRKPESFATFFMRFGKPMFGRGISRRAYTRTSMMTAGVGYLIMSPIFVAVGVYGLVRSLGG